MHLAKQDQPAAGKTAPPLSDVSRRDFLKGGVVAGAAAGVGLGAAYFGYEAAVRNPVRIGVIGTGDEGGVLIGAMNPNYVQVVAIADIRPYNIHRALNGDDSTPSAAAARPGLVKKFSLGTEAQARRQIRIYEGKYEELLNDPNVEAVIIALPLHLHAEASIKAMKKGKHVLCEKLMAHTVHEAKEMALMAKQTNCILAVGHQRHYSILYDNAVEAIRRGLIGDVHHIRAQWFRGEDSWQAPLPNEAMEKEVAKYTKESDDLLAKLAGLQADTPPAWNADSAENRDKAELGRRQKMLRLLDRNVDASKYGYSDFVLTGPNGEVYKGTALEELIRWRLFNRTSGGLMAELGAHQIDASSIFLSALNNDGRKVQPLSVIGTGGRHIYDFNRDSDDHVYQDMTIVGGAEKATTVQAAKGGAGPTIDTTESGGPKASKKLGGGGPVSKGYTEEIEHWAWCIRNRAPENQPRCHPEVALGDAVIALVSNMSLHQTSSDPKKPKKPIEFKPEWFQIDSPETPEGVAPDLARYKA
ncbi:MAG: Gfo/Idh/MocA family oxidoreductase [Planctomycetia bacterium]|nr:Gfo/Idh/MocA family oxidoreductase [Planctomycetia bacterium]